MPHRCRYVRDGTWFTSQKNRNLDSRPALLVHEEEALYWRLVFAAERERVGRIANQRAVDKPPSRTHRIAMQMSLYRVIRFHTLVPLVYPAVEVHVWPLNAPKTYGVSMMESHRVPQNVEIHMESISHDPFEVGEAVGKVVIHEVLQRIALAGVRVHLVRDARMVAVAADHGN